MTQNVIIPYTPRPIQSEVHAALDKYKRVVLVFHRRFGKTVLAVNHLIKAALCNPLRSPRYAYIAPTYKAAKRIAWTYLKYYTGPFQELRGYDKHETELRITLPGDRQIMLMGAENVEAFRGMYLDGLVLDEAALMPLDIDAPLLPTLTDRKGFRLYLGTPNGRQNAFYKVYQQALLQPNDWYARLLTIYDTGVFSADEIRTIREIDCYDDDEQFRQEYLCDFSAAATGTIFEEMIIALRDAEPSRVTSVPHDPMYPVYTGWDLGVNDPTAVWFVQLVGSECRVIDYYEVSDKGIVDHIKEVKGKSYVYGEHFMPHDVSHREPVNGRRLIDIAAELGLRSTFIPKTKKSDQMNAAKMLLPRCVFDSRNCAKGLERLEKYSRKFNRTLGIFLDEAVHDDASHGADAFMTLAMGLPRDGRVLVKNERIVRLNDPYIVTGIDRPADKVGGY